MNEIPSKQKDPSVFPYIAYGVIAAVSEFVSLIIGLVALNKFAHLSDGGMFAIALMIFAPGVMGIGISAFVCLTSKSNNVQIPRERLHDLDTRSEGITTFPQRNYDTNS